MKEWGDGISEAATSEEAVAHWMAAKKAEKAAKKISAAPGPPPPPALEGGAKEAAAIRASPSRECQSLEPLSAPSSSGSTSCLGQVALSLLAEESPRLPDRSASSACGVRIEPRELSASKTQTSPADHACHPLEPEVQQQRDSDAAHDPHESAASCERGPPRQQATATHLSLSRGQRTRGKCAVDGRPQTAAARQRSRDLSKNIQDFFRPRKR